MKLIVYHGTTSDFQMIDLSNSQNRRDFGRGFYTTTISSQAESWARNKKIRTGSQKAYVYVYEAEFSEELRIKQYDGLSVEWLEIGVLPHRSRREGVEILQEV